VRLPKAAIAMTAGARCSLMESQQLLVPRGAPKPQLEGRSSTRRYWARTVPPFGTSATPPAQGTPNLNKR
jgi:hypothetical protein